MALLEERRRERLAGRSVARRRLIRAGIALAFLVVLVVGGSAIYLDSQLHRIGHLNGVHVQTVAKGGAENILLVGSTDRCLVKPAKNFEAWVKQCAAGVNGNNSDVVMILRLVPGRSPTLLSFPRDTFIPDARAGDLSNRIDAALYNGPNQLIQAIEEDFGIPINHFVVLNFETFTNIVDVLGGITLYFPTSLKDTYSGLDISHSGCLHISGAEALALVRARHVQFHYNPRTHIWRGYDGSGDIGRIERDHIFLKVLGTEVAARGLGNPLTDSRLLSAIAPNLTVDSGFSTTAMLHLILDNHSAAAKARQLTLPIVEDTQNYIYKGYNYDDVVFPTEPADQQAIDEFMGGKPLGAAIKPSTVSVSVLDSIGSPSAAAVVRSGLASLGYTTSAGGSTTPVGPIAETTVRYADAAHLADAERVLRSLSGTVVLAKGPTTGGADVSVLVGSDLSVDTPVQSAAAVSGPASATTASASLTPLAPPTAATSAIPPFDPRACAAHPGWIAPWRAGAGVRTVRE